MSYGSWHSRSGGFSPKWRPKHFARALVGFAMRKNSKSGEKRPVIQSIISLSDPFAVIGPVAFQEGIHGRELVEVAQRGVIEAGVEEELRARRWT